MDCPEAELACADVFWLSHEILLAPRVDLEDVIRAVEKVHGGDLAVMEPPKNLYFAIR